MSRSALDQPLAFATEGGDAWTFHKTIKVDVPDGACDRVAFRSALSRATVPPHHGIAEAALALGPGDNWVEAQCRRAGIARGAAIRQEWRVRLRDGPTAQIRITGHGSTFVLDAAKSARAPARPAPILHYRWRTAAGNPAPIVGLPATGARLVLPVPAHDGRYEVALKIADARHRSDETRAVFRVRHGRVEPIDAAHAHPAWAANAVIYGVVPKLFGDRGLADVTGQLDRLAALGINTLWLSPITPAPHGDFGYAVIDYFHVRSSYGEEADLHRLVAAAHARGMHVILDFVPDHLSDRHPYFADAAAQGRHSPYYDFFQRTADGAAAFYFDWSNLKNLNYDNHQVRQLVIAAASYWVRTFHVDGFRVDAAWGPRQRDPGFWPRFSAALKRINPDLLLIAESSAQDSYYLSHGFDAAYDWTDKLGQWAWQEAFDAPANTTAKLRAALAASPGAGVLRFLDNNDTGARFVVRYGIGRTRVGAAMLLTLPGLPALYTGDEVGAAYQPYMASSALSWTDAERLEPWYARLIALRKREPALHSDRMRLLDMTPAANVLAYLRGAPRRNGVIVLLNFGPTDAAVALTEPSLARRNGNLVDLLTGTQTSFDQLRSGLRIEAYGVRVLKIVNGRH